MTSIAVEDLPELSLDEMAHGEPWIVDGAFGPPFGGSPCVYLYHLDEPEPIAVTVSWTISLKHWSSGMPVAEYTAMLIDACKLWPSPIGLRFEDAYVETDTEEDIVEFSYSIRSSSKDLAGAYAAAESLLAMIVNRTDPALEASGSTPSPKTIRRGRE